MDRRSFLRFVGLAAPLAVAAALVPDPERLLWVPGAKRIFLPAATRPRLQEFVVRQSYVDHVALALAREGQILNDLLPRFYGGWAHPTMLKVGDVFTIEGRYIVNP